MKKHTKEEDEISDLAKKIVSCFDETGLRMCHDKYTLVGYLFNGRFYKSLDELKGRTFSDDSKPIELFTKETIYVTIPYAEY